MSRTSTPRFRSYLKDDTSDTAGAGGKLLSIEEAMTLVGVGTLYPSILRSEIESLQARKVRTDRWQGLYP